MHKLLKILLAGLVCLGSMVPAFADESAGVLPCTLTAENGKEASILFSLGFFRCCSNLCRIKGSHKR